LFSQHQETSKVGKKHTKKSIVSSFKNLVQTQLSMHQETDFKPKKKNQLNKIIAAYGLEEMNEANSLIMKVLIKDYEKLGM
jgi:hypothetical protein